jgi:hypothetical protein
MPQVMFEVIYETKDFNDPALWPEDGSQPFVYSFGDQTGYANHGDYLFGWKDDSLQKIMDEECFVNCKSMKMQSIQQMNACSTTRKVVEDIGNANCESSDVRVGCVLTCHRADFAAWPTTCRVRGCASLWHACALLSMSSSTMMIKILSFRCPGVHVQHVH